MTRAIEFTIPGLPAMTNSARSHWAGKHREAKRWKREVWAAIQLPWLLKGDPMLKARVAFTRHSTHEPDTDGLVSGFKHVLDGLVEARVIIGDKPSQVTCTYSWERAPRGKGFISVRVEEVGS